MSSTRLEMFYVCDVTERPLLAQSRHSECEYFVAVFILPSHNWYAMIL
jgi:hypothetical protein